MDQPTALEQFALELTNRARANPDAEAARLGIDLNQGLAPGRITADPKAPLAYHPLLIDAARAHGDWMLATDTFSHIGQGGSTPPQRVAAAGYVLAPDAAVGENISMRWGWGIELIAIHVEAMHDNLFRSFGHRLNTMEGRYREAGIGLSFGEYQGLPGVTTTQKYVRNGDGVFLLGVAFDDGDGDAFYDPGEGIAGMTVTVRDLSGTLVGTTTTMTAGGWQLAVAPGSFTVTFSGGGLPGTVTRTANATAGNAKLDLERDQAMLEAVPLVNGTDGPDALVQGAGPAEIRGLGGNDSISAGAGADTLVGGEGNDVLDGGTEADRMEGGPGDDTYVVDNAGDLVVEAEGQGTDTVLAFVNTVLPAWVENLLLYFPATDGTGNGLANTLRGNGWNNLLDGAGGDDLIFAETGADLVVGRSGNDTVLGGGGGDAIDGNEGEDLLYGDGEGDVIFGRDGHDTVEGGLDNDILMGEEGLEIGTGNDLVRGGWGTDQVNGGAGADTLFGDGGIDMITGGTGNDVIAGGGGIDAIDPGPGADIVVYATLWDFFGGDADADYLVGIEAGVDVFDLRQVFDMLGAPDLSAAALRAAGWFRVVQSGGDALLQVDGNGGGDGFATAARLVGVSAAGVSDAMFLV